jgi:serine phosphatase RsbU (regulator of sigma subunit)
VGGDLVDIIRRDDGWTAYVADVSGHGIPAGMIMSMVKSAVHMAASDSLPMDAQLVRLNRVLKQLFAPNVFVTFACVSTNQDGSNEGNRGANDDANHKDELQFSIAGHPPILHCSQADATVHELSLENPPLAVLPQVGFTTARLRCCKAMCLPSSQTGSANQATRVALSWVSVH